MAAPAALPSLATPLDTLLLTSTSCVERVLLAQAVFAKGYSTTPAVAGKVWEEVKGALRGHALLRNREKEGGGWFEAENFKAIYEAMCREAGFEAEVDRPAQSADLRKIAHTYYMQRVNELYAGMQECQDAFRITYAELNELKEGKMDWRFSEPGRMAPPGSSPVVKMEGLPV